MIERSIRHFAIVFGSLAFVACQTGGKPAPTGPAPESAAATILGRIITVQDLDDRLGKIMVGLQEKGDPGAIYRMRMNGIEKILNEIALNDAAAAAGVSPQEHLTQQLDALGEPTEEEMAPLYEVRDSLPPDTIVAEGLEDRLRMGATLMRMPKVFQSLRDQAHATILLVPPASETGGDK